MLSLPKHLYRTVAKPCNGAVEMLWQAQHEGRYFANKNRFLQLIILAIRGSFRTFKP
jgi:hypothetical protein